MLRQCAPVCHGMVNRSALRWQCQGTMQHVFSLLHFTTGHAYVPGTIGGVIRRESGTFGAASTDSLSVGGVRDYNANFSIVGRVVKSVLNGQNDPTLVAILSHFSIVFSNVPFRQVSCHQRHSYFSLDSGTPMELPHTPAKCTHVTVRAC